ncbi:hypothetical protein [Thermococcus henrietii]|uniref:hypothetical protein n=1 Tax=Thermococcus henrietii TaxID=2016361 RepID=UPI000C0882FB|nr:hypothetical protein [Thermococcus henrietii]
MEDVEELKSVLERVEGKLIASRKIYGALTFSAWLTAMMGYYVLSGLFGNGYVESLVYWAIGAVIVSYATKKVWDRYIAVLVSETGKESGIGLEILASWAIGSLIGWGIIPRLGLTTTPEETVAVAILSFLGISLAGQALVTGDREEIPSFLAPLLGIPLVPVAGNQATLWAGFVAAFGFSLTIALYLLSAFKAIER